MCDWKIKYRPSKIENFVGNTEVIKTFINDITASDNKRSYFISGDYGIGKTTLARIGAKHFLKADDFNITEINASDDRGIDTVRELKDKCALATSTNRIWILDEFQETTKNFQNAILKLLEEGSDKDYFFICTTEPEKVLGTVKSRCGKYHLQLPTASEIQTLLLKIITIEKLQISEEVLLAVIKQSENHVRDAVDLLQSVSKLEPEQAMKYLKQYNFGLSETPEIIDFVRALFARKEQQVKNLLEQLNDKKINPESIRRIIMSYGAKTLLKNWNFMAAVILENYEKPYYDTNSWPLFILDTYRAVTISNNNDKGRV